MAMTNFRARVPLGQTGLLVSRIGVGSSMGVGITGLERAYHEYGVNYLYWGSFRRPAFGRAMHTLAKKHREDLVLTVQSYSPWPALLGPSVDIALLRSGLEYFDLLLLGKKDAHPAEAFTEEFLKLKDRGKVRHLAMSSHNRPLLPALFAELERGESQFSTFMVRYNAVHRGAEKQVFPFKPKTNPPGLIAYTATRWGHLLDPAKMPGGERTPMASDCYRFALTHPAVDMVLCGPKDEQQMAEACRALDQGPMDADELAWMRRVGDHIYGKYKPAWVDQGDQKPPR